MDPEERKVGEGFGSLLCPLSTRVFSRAGMLLAALPLWACDGPLSAMAPAGRDAESIAGLFAWMAGGAFLIWLFVMSLAVYALMVHWKAERRLKARLYIVGGGTLFTAIVLTGLLIYGLGMMPSLLRHGSDEGPKIRVIGEQWWWRVQYELPDGRSFELANEIWLPLGHRTPLWFESRDVIHSFWVPSLAGKMDMIPGRVTRLGLEPTKQGIYWGACAEYCGASHANMLFRVAVVEPQEFERWVNTQAQAATAPSQPSPERGAALFETLGCGACHTIRGTRLSGEIGPDLTHVGGRLSIGAGILEPSAASFRTWLVRTDELKPDVHMPAFDMLPEEDVVALGAYLDGLK